MNRTLALLLVTTLVGCSSVRQNSDSAAVAEPIVVADFETLPALDGLIEGRADALVTVHSFVDPASPRFGELYAQFARLQTQHDGELRLVVRAPAHPSPAGYDVLVALRAAGMQGKQAETWAALIGWRNAWKTGGALALVASMSAEIGLDREQLRTVIEEGSAAKVVDAEMEWARNYGVDGALALNGRLYFDMFEATPLDAAMSASFAQARALVADGAPRAELFKRSATANLDADSFGEPFIDSEIVPIGKSPTFGNSAAAVKVVAFMDFQCPYSRRAAVTLSQLVSENRDVELVFKHMPLEFHQQAREAAAISVAAAAQGRFWEMSEQLFLNQARFGNESMDELAAELGNALHLDVARLLDDREAATAIVDSDARLAAKLGIRGTPYFLINGAPLSGAMPLEVFQQAVAEQLIEATKLDVMAREVYATAVAKNFTQPAPPKPVEKDSQPPYAVVPVGDSDPVRGATDFAVTIVEFADYQCPFCQRAQATLKRVAEENPDKVRFVFKHRPLPFHKSAAAAAAAAVAAGNQGKFWAMHDALFAETLPAPGEMTAFSEKIARKLGLKLSKFKKDRDAAQAKVTADDEFAVSLGVRGTPTFFINGRRLAGARPYDDFATAIAEEAAFADTVAAETKLSKDALYDEVMKRRTQQ